LRRWIQSRTATSSSAPSGCHVVLWHVKPDATPAHSQQDADFLSPDERLRAARFQFDRDRARHVTARATLRRVLIYIHEEPVTLHFSYGPYGRPELYHPKRSTRFNVSHSSGRPVIAVTERTDVGVDIEVMRSFVDAEALARLVFSPATLQQLASNTDQSRAFLRGWAATVEVHGAEVAEKS
jgi:4'-phosphopantetheinyl transferase